MFSYLTVPKTAFNHNVISYLYFCFN